jgi:hypothetical protein
MPTDPGDFVVGRLANVEHEIKEIVQSLSYRHQRKTILDLLEFAYQKLRNSPTTFGDPLYSKKYGGVVYHRVLRPLAIRYVVFEPERRVCILKITRPADWDIA